MYTTQNRNKGLIILLFIFSPFVALLASFKSYRSGWFKNLIWAFVIFYGLTFTIGNESENSDINRYINEVKVLHQKKDFNWEGITTYWVSTGEIDFLRTVIAILVSRISDHQAVLLMVYATIFGFFFSRNIVFILQLLNEKLNFWQKVSVLLLILVVPIWFINGFRMYTAFHVFMYGLLPYLMFRNKKMLLFSLLSVFIHFSFILPIIILFIYIFFGNKYKAYFILFLLSLVVSELDASVINNLFNSYVPDFMLDRTESYFEEDKINSHRNTFKTQDLVWYVIWYLKLFTYALQFLLIYLFFKKIRNIKKSDRLLNLFSLSLLFYIFTNFVSSIPSGLRFVIISNFLTLLLVLLYMQKFPKDYSLTRKLILISPILFLFVFVSLRISLYSMSINTLIGNPISALLTIDQNISINDLIK